MPRLHLPRALPLVQDGLVTRAGLTGGGVGGDLADRLVRQGEWQRLAPSTYLAGNDAPTDAQLVAAAREHVGEDLVVTGLLACRAFGMVDVPDEPGIEVLIGPGSRRVSTGLIRVQQTTRMPRTWTIDGVRYAVPARALVDGARRLPDVQSARALLLGAVCARRCTALELSVEVEAGAQRGSGLVRRVVDDALAGAWSAPEAEAAHEVGDRVQAGQLPPFLLNPVLRLGSRRVGQPDGYLVGHGVGWQVQSRRHHAEGDDFEQTLAVHDGYAAHDLTMLHVTPKRLRQLRGAWPELLVQALAARGGRGEPVGLRVEPIGPLQLGERRRPLPPRAA